jgi:hypothetical protein
MNTARETREGVSDVKIAYNPMPKIRVVTVFRLYWKCSPEVFHPAVSAPFNSSCTREIGGPG